MVALLAVAGCANTGGKPATKPADKTTPTVTANDPCANRLQDLSGGLLLFYLEKGRLPDSLEEMERLPGNDDLEDPVCPVSGKAYVYVADGIFLPEQHTRVIVYDATPAHPGFRWAITIGNPEPGKPLITKVIGLPESTFTFRR